MDKMDMDWGWIKLGLTGVVGAAFTAWRLQIVLGIVLVLLMCIDYATGTCAAKRAGTWSSKAAREGFDHKIGSAVVVIVAVMADIVFTAAAEMMPWNVPEWPWLWMTMAEIWYCLTEAGSVLENCAKMGVWVPKWFLAAISAGTAVMDQVGGQAAAQIGQGAKDEEGVENG